jgi:hypothetical protein
MDKTAQPQNYNKNGTSTVSGSTSTTNKVQKEVE